MHFNPDCGSVCHHLFLFIIGSIYNIQTEVFLSQWLLNKTTRAVAWLLNENLSHILFSQTLFCREREREREVKNVKYFLLKELSELIFCLTFVKDAFILNAGER